jgi:hypothetical protein
MSSADTPRSPPKMSCSRRKTCYQRAEASTRDAGILEEASARRAARAHTRPRVMGRQTTCRSRRTSGLNHRCVEEAQKFSRSLIFGAVAVGCCVPKIFTANARESLRWPDASASQEHRARCSHGAEARLAPKPCRLVCVFARAGELDHRASYWSCRSRTLARTHRPPNGHAAHLSACLHLPRALRTKSARTRRFSAGPTYGTRSGAAACWTALQQCTHRRCSIQAQALKNPWASVAGAATGRTARRELSAREAARLSATRTTGASIAAGRGSFRTVRTAARIQLTTRSSKISQERFSVRRLCRRQTLHSG